MTSRPRILIVDDDANLRKTLADILHLKGFEVYLAGSGKAGLETARRQLPEIALLDLKLGDMSGLAVLKSLKELLPEMECILLTGHASQESAIQAINLGAFQYLQKPYEIEQLLVTIHRALESITARQKVHESEDRYRAIFERANDAILLSDDSVIIECNQKALELFGCRREDLVGASPLKFAPPFQPDGKPSAEEESRRINAVLQGEPQVFEFRHQRLDGSLVDVEISLSRLVLQGKPYIQGFLHDITERKEREKALHRRAEELAALQATLLEITSPHDLPDLLRTIVERAARLLNAPSGGMYLCHPQRQEVRCVVSYHTPSDYTGTVLKYGEGLAGTIALTQKPLNIDDYRTWSGRASVFEEEKPFTAVVGVPMIWQGQATGVIDILHNEETRCFSQADLDLLTLFASHATIAVENARLYEEIQQELVERSRAEAALSESQRMLATLMANLHGMAYRCKEDPDWTMEFVSQGCYELLGYRSEELVGEGSIPFARLIHPDDLPRVRDTANTAIQQHRSFELFYRVTTACGVEKWVWEQGLGIYNAQGDALATEGFMTDISERILAEETLHRRVRQQAAVAELGRLALQTDDLQSLMNQVARLAAEGLGVEYSIIDELVDGKTLQFKAGMGWNEILQQFLSFEITPHNLPGYTVMNNQPVIVEDFSQENRFQQSPLLESNQVASGISLVIPRGEQPFGFMAAYSRHPMKFSTDDVNFLQSLANTLAAAIQRQQTGQALRASESSYRRLIETASEGIWMLDANFKVSYLNEQMAGMLGCPLEEILDKPLLDFTFEEDKPKVYQDIEDRRQGKRDLFEHKYRRKDGSACWGLVSANPVFDENGTFLGSFSMVTDITARKEADEALQVSRERYQRIVETANEGVMAGDGEGQITYVNQKMADMLGYTPEELLGINTTHLIFPEDQADNERRRLERIAGQRDTYERRLKRKDGSACWVLNSTVPTFDKEGRYAGSFRMMLDINDRKQAELARQRQFEELTILHAVASLGSEADSVDDLVEGATRIIGKTLHADNLGVLLLDEQDGRLHLRGKYQGLDLQYRIPQISLGKGVTGTVAMDGLSRRIPDVSREPAYISLDPRICSELCVPLKVEKRIIGVLNIESSLPDAFSEDDERLMLTLAGQLATAVQRLRLNEELQRKLEELHRRSDEITRLYRASQALVTSGPPDINTISWCIVNAVLIEFGHANCSLLVVSEPNTIVSLAAVGLYQHSFEEPLPLDGSGLIALAIRSGKIQNIPDVSQSPNYLPCWEEARSELVTPLIVGQQVIGAIDIQSSQPGAFTPDDERLMSVFAERAALALENARLFEETQQRSRELAGLYETTRDLAGVTELNSLLETIVERATRLLGVSTGGIDLYDAETDQIVVSVTKGLPIPIGARYRMGEGLVGQVAQTRQPQVFEDYPNWEERPVHLQNVPLASSLAVPMLYAGELIGVLVVDELEPKVRKFNEAEIQLLATFATQAAGAVQAARLLDQTRHRLEEMEAVSRVSSAMRAAETLEEMLPRLLDETLAVFDAKMGGILLLDADSSRLQPFVIRGWPSANIQETIAPNPVVFEKVLHNGEVHIISDVYENPHPWADVQEKLQPGWCMAFIPIRTEQTTIGVMLIGIHLPRQFTSEEVKIMTTLAEIAGNAIHRTRLHDEIELRMRRLVALNMLDQAINSSFDLRVTFSILLDQLIGNLSVDAANVLLYQSASQSLSVAANAGFHGPPPASGGDRLGHGLAGRALFNQETVTIPDLSQPILSREFTEMVKREGFVTYHGVPLVVKGELKGVLETYHRKAFEANPEWLNFLQTLAGHTAIAIDNIQLFENLQQSNRELGMAYDATIEGWSGALDMRDKETEGHTRRVVDITLKLATAMNVPQTELVHLRRGALLHDIGKMGVPDHILNKPGKLTEAEWEVMRKHPGLAYNLLAPIRYLRPAVDIPYCHHEKWDGSGYPRGLKGEEIPKTARIFAVIDVWDALTSDRPYRPAWPQEKALNYIREQSGKHFDPQVVDTFLRLFSNGRSVHLND